MTRWLLLTLGLVAPAAVRASDPPAKPTPEQIEFFEKQVRPVLVEHCVSCHGPKKQSAGLRLDTAAGLKAGADGLPVVTAGDPAKSRLVAAVKREGDYPMPPKGPLPPEAVAALAEWVKAGAAFPDDAAAARPAVDPKAHWAFRPVKQPPVPEVKAAGHAARNEIDAFVLAKLNDNGLSPAKPADRRTLIRRAYYDLTGLPPTAAEVEAFENDTDPKAWEKLIDRLLASPQYGERWGRYWLDLARYADTKGYVFQEDRNYPFAYTYRDYVIRSFNEDKPYDRFVIEQLAADRLDLGDDKRPLAAMGFLTLGRRFLNNQQDIIDDRIDVVTRGLMGLTVSCARCHDHKFDPVPTADYYSLYGVFASSTEPRELPLIGEQKRTPEVVAFEKAVEKQEAEYAADRERRFHTAVQKLREPAAVAQYLHAALEVRGKTAEQLRGFARERDLRQLVLERWKAHLDAEVKAGSPVFGPLAKLAEIPEKDFATKAGEVIDGFGNDANPLVVNALKAAKPQSLKAACEAVAGVVAANLVGPPTPEQAEAFKSLSAGGPLDIPPAEADGVFNRLDRDGLTNLRKKIDAFKAASPVAPPRAHVLNDAARPTQPVVFNRGNPNNRGPAVPRQAPAVVSPNRKPFTDGSGRLELAKAIASPDNPLTARVFVNRIWAGHFGQGLVRTPSDFGVRSDPPTHPELLDWLAARFVQDGWSVKRLHKLVMLSATYQQSSAVSADLFKLDPENKLLARQNRRRLDFEAARDSLLAASGKLDLAMGGKPVDLFKAPFSTRRSVYGLIDRTNFPGVFRSFDVASPDQHAPQRFQTTVPQQALFLMNSPFVTEQARALANRDEVTKGETPAAKVTALYRLALGRNPTPGELALAEEFVADADPKPAFGRWPQLAQVLLLSNEFAFVD
jgi:mono/diheme cytochrome c family protein